MILVQCIRPYHSTDRVSLLWWLWVSDDRGSGSNCRTVNDEEKVAVVWWWRWLILWETCRRGVGWHGVTHDCSWRNVPFWDRSRGWCYFCWYRYPWYLYCVVVGCRGLSWVVTGMSVQCTVVCINPPSMNVQTFNRVYITFYFLTKESGDFDIHFGSFGIRNGDSVKLPAKTNRFI